MDIFDVLSLVGGLCLFLFGMDLMGAALERRAGGSLRAILGRLTNNKWTGFLTGLGVTAIIQSSSATTVMVVGFVNSGLMTLRQSISVIMGANIGTTITSWILSLGGIASDNIFMKLLKPTSFTPVLALVGIAMLMFGKSSKKKDTATILLGFATLMFGMDTMTTAVSDLADIPAFQNLFLMFKNPILGVLVGAVLTAVIQSSSASIGILQALAITGQVSYAAAIPIIMGQNIGTCITAILSSFGTNKNAKRAAVVHLSFNVIGTLMCLLIFSGIAMVLKPVILNESASLPGIAICHSLFNILCTAMLLPASGLLEKIAYRIVPENEEKDVFVSLDERLIGTPSIALQRCNAMISEMAEISTNAFRNSLELLKQYDAQIAEKIREDEDKVDKMEDILGTYLVKLSRRQLNDTESTEVSKFLKAIGDFERISDHSVNVLESAEELHEKNISFTADAQSEIETMSSAVSEILALASEAFIQSDLEIAKRVEPLEQVIDRLKIKLRDGHIGRLKEGHCSIEAGFIWADLITNLERTADHCSSVAVCVIEASHNSFEIHEYLSEVKAGTNENYNKLYEIYAKQYGF